MKEEEDDCNNGHSIRMHFQLHLRESSWLQEIAKKCLDGLLTYLFVEEIIVDFKSSRGWK